MMQLTGQLQLYQKELHLWVVDIQSLGKCIEFRYQYEMMCCAKKVREKKTRMIFEHVVFTLSKT